MLVVPAMGVIVMSVTMSVGGWIEVDLRRRPAEDALKPAAKKRDSDQAAHEDELIPEIRQAARRTAARSDGRPDRSGEHNKQNQRRPTAFAEDGPTLPPIDGPQPPGDPHDPERMAQGNVADFADDIAEDGEQFPERLQQSHASAPEGMDRGSLPRMNASVQKCETIGSHEPGVPRLVSHPLR